MLRPMSRPLRIPPAVELELSLYLEWLGEHFGERLREVRLYGSYARAEAHEESDVDLLVLAEDATHADWRACVDRAADLHILDGYPMISPLVLSPEQWADWLARERAFPREVEREGIRL